MATVGNCSSIGVAKHAGWQYTTRVYRYKHGHLSLQLYEIGIKSHRDIQGHRIAYAELQDCFVCVRYAHQLRVTL